MMLNIFEDDHEPFVCVLLFLLLKDWSMTWETC